jgi:hemerythrin-like domain-containing protein
MYIGVKMTALESLYHDHEIIIIALDSADKELIRIQNGGIFSKKAMVKILDFFKNFADGYHNMKEELYLFEMLSQKGMAKDNGPIGAMLTDHNEGRNYLTLIAENLVDAGKGSEVAIIRITQYLKAYTVMLRNHIFTEHNILFPMAGKKLNDSEKLELNNLFDKLLDQKLGKVDVEKYYELAYDLVDKNNRDYA